MSDRDVGNVVAPDVVWPRDRQLPQQVWINSVLRVLFAGVWSFVDGLQAHDAHQTAHTVTTRTVPISRQIGCDLAAAKERVFREHSINLVHQF